MSGVPSSRPRQLVLSVGLALAVGLASALALWPRVAPNAGLDTADALEDWLHAHPEAVSAVVWNVDTGDELAAWNADRPRPVAGLTALLLATEYARQAENGLDTTYQVPASVRDRRRLPVVEARSEDLGALAMPALVRAAVRGNRPAGDELIRILGRDGVEGIPRQLDGRPAELEPPVPVAGLLLAWAPAQWSDGTTAAEQADRFARLPRVAQRDSAHARERAFQNSVAYRAEETARLQSHGFGMPESEIQAAATATFPRGTARAYADLLARAADSTLISPAIAAHVRRSLRASPGDSVRSATGAIVGLVGTAVLVQTPEGRIGAVVLVEGLPTRPDAQAAHAQAAVELAERWARSPVRVRPPGDGE